MLNKPSALRMVSGIFFAAFFSLSVAALQFKEEVPPGATVPEVPAEPAVSSDATAPEIAAAPPGKVVYKSVDSNGNVTFTDSAPIGRPSEAIRVPAANLLPGHAGVSGVGASGTLKEEEPVNYTITITSPANDTLFGQEVESIALAAQLEPGLQKGHTFQLYYDGKPVGNGDAAYLVTVMERGTHTVAAKVFDSEKKVVKSVTPVKFHIRRISKLLPESSDKNNEAQANPNGPKLDPSPDKKDAGAPSAKGGESAGGTKSNKKSNAPLGAGGGAMGAAGAGGAR